MRNFIDKTKVAEAQVRMRRQQEALRKGDAAADALAWFQYCALNSDHPGQVRPNALEASPKVVASSVHGAKPAQEYVSAATAHYLGEILERAIAMAQADLARAEAVMKGNPQ